MKKTITGVVVLLAAALIGLKYFAAKNQVGMPQPAPQPQTEQQGVALPPGSTSYQPISSMPTFTPTQGSGNYEMIALPAAALDLKGACEGGSPKEIIENHGKTWGYFTGRRNAFDPPKTQDLYNHIWDYYACTAASRQDSTICSELPGEPVKDAVKFGVPRYESIEAGSKNGQPMSPMDQCRSKTVVFLFKAYAAGKAKDQRNCLDYVSDLDPEAQSMFTNPAEFCAAVGQGPDKGDAYLKQKMPKAYPIAEKMMAMSEKVCGSDAACLANHALWVGITSGSPAKCPDAYKPNCAALAQKSPGPCASILADMSKKYCGYYKDLVKHGGGYAGATPEEVKASLEAAAAKKKEEERLRKQEEAATKQINEKVRKLMGKKGGE